MTRPPRRPRRALIALVATGALAMAASTAAAQQNPVAKTIDAFASKNPTISVLVERMGPTGPATIASWRPSTALAPASTMKIITAASALMTVGPDFRFTTRVEAGPDTKGPGGTVNGPAYLIGAGDPMLSTRAYSRANFRGLGTPIDDLARDIREKGTTRITGGVVVDETLFDRQRLGPLWKSSYRYECPPLSGIATNQNRADNGANVSSPAIAAGQRLAAALRRQGVRVSGPVRAGRDAPGGAILGQVRSKPMSRILGYMNATSDNFIAETLTKGVGAYGTGRGSTPAGTRRAEQLMRERGVLTASDDFIDGSGLSHSNRVSATTLVGVLKDAQANPQWGRVLIDSMPRGGEGTLIRRLKGPAVRYRVHAKTGYINGVASLAGTVTSKAGVPYAFAFLMNTSDVGGAQKAMDRAVTLLATGRADSAT
ncbi:MAG: D-alanyl-D-alanine carboxypeptidase/D-alanyl-D-alanine-endopeptidase [Thermoleophilia bacterium]|nr:D-alanyl-D-alanine carboxypeptidase/D-alanyl-D-alanine-endopeptidase [Thermoleophilia bacterium]